MKPTLPLAFAALLLAAPALATEPVQQTGRYTLVVVDDGFIRLDTQSGEIARCTGDPDKLTCRLAADERLAYIGEIERLESRIDALEERVAALEARPESRRGRKFGQRRDFGLPSDEEIDEALDMTDKVFRRFFGMVQDLKRDLEEDRL
jgi:hypothetical protein